MKSLFVQAGLTVLAVMRYRQGAADAFDTSYGPDDMKQPTPSPYSAYPTGESGDPYQQQPFSAPDDRPAAGGEFQQPPTY